MKRQINKIWIPFWVDKWLFGSTRIELEPDERSVWLDLLAIASKNDGYIRANETTPYPESQLAGLLVISTELLQRTIKKCIEYGKIVVTKEGTYFVSNWDKYQLSKRQQRRIKHNIKENKTKEKKIKEASASADIASEKADTVGKLPKSQKKPNPEKQSLLNYAKSKGFAEQGTKLSNGRYAWHLLQAEKLDGAKQLVDYAIECQGKQYAPQIHDFQKLYYKRKELRAYIEKQDDDIDPFYKP